MKKAVCTALCVIIMLFCGLPAMATDYKKYNAGFDLPDNYTEINADNAAGYESALEHIGYSVDSFKKYLQSNNILLFAVTVDNTRQLQFWCNKTEYSERIGDLAYLMPDKQEEVGEKLLGNTGKPDWNIIEIGNAVYFEAVFDAADENGSGSVEYITVKNGYLYNFAVYGDKKTVDGEFLEEAENIAGNLRIYNKKENITVREADNVLETVMIYIMLAVAVIVAVFICYTFIRDIKKRKSGDGDGEDMTIQRRKYK